VQGGGVSLGARRAILPALTLGGTKDLVKSMENIGHRINTVTVEP
jgi:hypothetical protein